MREKKNQEADLLSKLYPKNSASVTNLRLAQETNKDPPKARNILTVEEGQKKLRQTHEELRHPGQNALYRTLQPFFTMPNIKKEACQITRNCQTCRQNKPSKTNYDQLIERLPAEIHFQDVSTNVYGPITAKDTTRRGEDGSAYLLTFTDQCTRWTLVTPIKTITSEKIFAIFKKKWITPRGAPKTLLMDQGQYHISSQFQQKLKEHNIKPTYISAYYLQGNSMSERVNQTIARVLRCYPTISITQACARIEYGHQRTSHRVLGCSP
ncbi:hypothetical protein PAEPH01_1399 [Pancytospora epiphaga]|nr:hypothetical protein PAEPH01_1399 [Pancytospora epiphaga]